jgi:RNA polymerase sigma factor (TIGR02999 family)
MNDVTRVLSAIERGDPQAADRPLPLVYDELRRLAAQKLAQERPGQTLEETARVHEAYLRLVGADVPPRWDGRAHFFAAAAEAMRRILVEVARRRERPRHGGRRRRVELDDADRIGPPPDHDPLALDEALARSEVEGPGKARFVRPRAERQALALTDHPNIARVLDASTTDIGRPWPTQLLGPSDRPGKMLDPGPFSCAVEEGPRTAPRRASSDWGAASPPCPLPNRTSSFRFPPDMSRVA